MKKFLLLGVALAATIGITILLTCQNESPTESVDKIYAASSKTGFVAEKVIGNPNVAKVTIYEYADFGCSHCAEWNQKINALMSKHESEIALVFRTYDLGLFKNSPTAARAATAAQLQGYFKEYKDLLFKNQSEWFYEDDEDLDEFFCKLFKQASGGAGDTNKFIEDMESEAVKTRLNFEQNLGKKIRLSGTPTFRIDGENIKAGDLIEVIERKLEE